MNNSPFHLSGKTILVTGASSGIGKQIAISISKMGGTVVLTARNLERLEETFSQLEGNDHQIKVADLLIESQLTSLVEQLPKLDGVVHCAGFVKTIPIKYLNEIKINETFDINYKVQVLLMASISRKKLLNKKSSIVFMSSISSYHPHKGGTLYSGSKAALESFSKVIALEFFTQGIRSNCIRAAMVKTPMYEYAEHEASKETMDEHVSKYPLGVGEPSDIANATIYLLSDASKWMTGSTMVLDGGFLLGGL